MLTHYQNANPTANYLVLALFTSIFIFTLHILYSIYFIDISNLKSMETPISIPSLVLSGQIVAYMALCISCVRQISQKIEKIPSKIKSEPAYLKNIKILRFSTNTIACIEIFRILILDRYDPIYVIPKIIFLVIFIAFVNYFTYISEKILLNKIKTKYLNKSISEFIGLSKFIFPGFLIFALALNLINIIFSYSYFYIIYFIGIVFECIFDILLIFIIVFSSRFFNNFRSVSSGL